MLQPHLHWWLLTLLCSEVLHRTLWLQHETVILLSVAVCSALQSRSVPGALLLTITRCAWGTAGTFLKSDQICTFKASADEK